MPSYTRLAMFAEARHEAVGMRATLRSILTWLLVGCLGAILVAVVGEWFIKVAEDKGWYSDAGVHWDSAVSAALTFFSSPAMLLGIGCLAGVVGGMWLDAVLLRRERKGAVRPKQVYLHRHEDPRSDELKSYLVRWSPSSYLHMDCGDYKSLSGSIGARAAETEPVFYLENVGPGIVRHLQLTWRLPVDDISREIQDSGIFAEVVKSLTSDRLELAGESAWVSRPLAENQLDVVPYLKEGEIRPIKMPQAFRFAFYAHALIATKRFTEEEGDVFAMPPRQRLLSPPTVEILYTTESGESVSIKYRLLMWLWARVATMAPAPDEDGEWYQEPSAITAWLDHITIEQEA